MNVLITILEKNDSDDVYCQLIIDVDKLMYFVGLAKEHEYKLVVEPMED